MQDEQDITDGWKYFLTDSIYPLCWACGLDKYNRPNWWHAPWFIQRAHIVHNPRKEDRRVAILLCPICHGTQHGERYPENDLPKLTVENMLWLKLLYDPEYYDREFCEQNTIGILPLPQPCPERYNTAYEQRRGRRPQSYIKE